ncbi:MAG TPA: PP2C family protein-serine/threonine phosphatase [Pseudonocardiaceae bacterium]|nr:PP2C family protein-serine/threonine phosphatase [Pseudonocardiaceae bacterium]
MAAADLSSVPDGPWPGAPDAGTPGDIVLVLDGEGLVQLANRAARQLFPDLVPGTPMPITDLLPALANRESGRRTSHDGGLRLEWRRHALDSDHLVWWGQRLSADDTAPPRRWWSDLGRIMEGSLTPDRIAADLARLAVPALADCCVVLLPAPLSRFRWWRCVASEGMTEVGMAPVGVAQGRVSERIVHAVPALGTALDDGPVTQRLAGDQLASTGWLLPAGFGSIGDAAVVPVRGPAGTTGLLVLANKAGERVIDLAVLDEFARQADTALDAAIRFGELATVTSGLESSLLPAALPDVSGIRIAAAYRPAQAGLRVGGDFYDVRHTKDGGAVWALGDACGHGPEAASLAGHVRSCFSALCLVEQEPRRLLDLLNQAIRPTSGSRFTTAVVGRVAIDGPTVRLTVGRAGHPPPLVLRTDGTVEDLMVTGGLLGVFPDVEFEQVEVSLAPNETCLIYSDGVLEARRSDEEGEQFGLDRLRRLLADYRTATAAALVDGVHGEVVRWLAGRHHDDITLLAIQAGPPSTDQGTS